VKYLLYLLGKIDFPLVTTFKSAKWLSRRRSFMVCPLRRFVQQRTLRKHLGYDGSQLDDWKNHKPSPTSIFISKADYSSYFILMGVVSLFLIPFFIASKRSNRFFKPQNVISLIESFQCLT